MILTPIARGSIGTRGFDPKLIFAAKNGNIIFHQKGTWTNTSGLVSGGFASNPAWITEDAGTTYTFTATMTRISDNATDYNILMFFGYTTNPTDNFGFGLQTYNSGNNSFFLHHRYNAFSTWLTETNFPVGSSWKIVGILRPNSATFWRTKTLSDTKSLSRPIGDSRYTFRMGFNVPSISLTNIAWWKRELSISEKDQYYDGTMPLFLT